MTPEARTARSEGGSGEGECLGRDLLPLVYAELRRLANVLLAKEPKGQTLQATSLVHEAFLRLSAGGKGWENRRHFFNAAALAMRRVLLDRARKEKRRRSARGAVPASDALDSVQTPAELELELGQLESLDAAIQALHRHNPRWAEVVHMRFIVGLSTEETADILGISASTVRSDWTFSRAWLRWAMEEPSRLRDGDPTGPERAEP